MKKSALIAASVTCAWLSTVSAQQALRSAGKSSRKQRPIIDQAAAVIILQHAIDAERASGTAPGRTFLPDEGL